jgi:hypothetical protein
MEYALYSIGCTILLGLFLYLRRKRRLRGYNLNPNLFAETVRDDPFDDGFYCLLCKDDRSFTGSIR